VDGNGHAHNEYFLKKKLISQKGGKGEPPKFDCFFFFFFFGLVKSDINRLVTFLY
jgi:hypothetical protein